MLIKDPSKRISAKKAFENKWIQKNTISDELDKDCLANLGQFYVFMIF